MFCFSCCSAVSKKGLVSTRNQASKGHEAFVVNGYENWKKAKQRFREHESSQLHIEAVAKLLSLRNPSVASQLSNQIAVDQNHRRLMLVKLLSSILARQGLAFRGHVRRTGK